MSYSAGEALVLTRLREVSGFNTTPANTSRGNFGILNSGAAAFYGILAPGPYSSEWETPTVRRWYWSTIIRVYQRYVDDGTRMTDLETNVQNVIDYFLKYQYLGSPTTILDAHPSSADQMQEIWSKDGGLSWLRWDVRIEWEEEQTVVYAE